MAEEPSPDVTLKVLVSSTKAALLAQEDTDGDGKITIDDQGPKTFSVATVTEHSNKSASIEISGTYRLSNLLQELVIAEDAGHETALIPWKQITEDPVGRIARRIRDMFWVQLTRRLDASSIEHAASDPKDWTPQPRLRMYVPSEEVDQLAYYQSVSRQRPNINLEVQMLPKGPLTAKYVKSLNSKPGTLALAMTPGPQSVNDGNDSMRGSAFIVPGGRFNELYYWDSYFCCLGLLECDYTSLVDEIVDNFTFEIKHYGQVLNANRTYYLGRSQPPFFTDLARRAYEKAPSQPESKSRLRVAILAAIKEYTEVWISEPRYDRTTGLSRYRPICDGFPPEVEAGHFDHIVGVLASESKMTNEDFIKAYDDGTIGNSKLDDFLRHDRAIRESGHDTSYRLEGVAADMATVDLNCLLYKYETDIAHVIRTVFDDDLDATDLGLTGISQRQTSAAWHQKAETRKQAIDKYLWNAEKGMFFDYNTATATQSTYESVTTLYALWCGAASPTQAASLVTTALPKFEQPGGLACCTEASRGPILGAQRPQKQWDYPFAWAPHQILAWDGLQRYGYEAEARRLAYRWLHMVTTVAVNFNGALVEKYDVTQLAASHRVRAEYGNQGLDFRGLAREGFGWTNASYVYGLSKINEDMKRALGRGMSFDDYRGSGLPL